MDSQKISRYSRNMHRSFSAYSTCFQHMVEQAFLDLSEKYALPIVLIFSHNHILQTLYYQEKPLTFAEISRRSGQALSNVSVAANALQQDGLICCEKLENDRRKYAVVLSELGKKVCDDYLNHYLSHINDLLFDGFSVEEITCLTDSLERLEHNAHLCAMQLDREKRRFPLE